MIELPGARATTRATVPDSAGAELLRVTDLRVHFDTGRGPIRAVDGVSLRLPRATTLAIVGESGSGKSVTGLTIMRLLGRTSARVVDGTIIYTGKGGRAQDLLRLSEAEMRQIRGREIAMIFQDPTASLNPVFTVGDQVMESLELHRGLKRKQAREAAAELFALVGITAPRERLDAFPHQLSGGMRQRVMIAMALASDPLLLIADEPTTALDVTIQAQIVSLLKRLQMERGMGMIFVTHDLGLVAEIADRVAVMYAAQIVEEGPAAIVLGDPRHPYTRALLACNPHHALDRLASGAAPEIRAIPGVPASPLDPPPACRFHPRCPFAVDACRSSDPLLRPIGPDHRSRCIRAEELP